MTWLNNLLKNVSKKITCNQFEKVENLDKLALLNNLKTLRKNIKPFSVTYSPTLLIVKKQWHILNINNPFGDVFIATSVIAFSNNISLIQMTKTF